MRSRATGALCARETGRVGPTRGGESEEKKEGEDREECS